MDDNITSSLDNKNEIIENDDDFKQLIKNMDKQANEVETMSELKSCIQH